MRTHAVGALIALIAWSPMLAEAQQRPARKIPEFEGKAIPDPPGQGQPWTPPASKLPKFLLSATGWLFEAGLPDPRGCEYRSFEAGDGWAILEGRGFVLPERADVPGRFVVAWDGLVYPVATVGPPADLDADVKALAEALRRDRDVPPPQNRRFDRGPNWSFDRQFGRRDYQAPQPVEDRSPLKLAMLLRLGRADLAESLFAAATTWDPGRKGRDLTDYHINFVSLADDWAGSAYRRLISAHMRGSDVVALDVARRIARFRDRVEARADEMGFSRPDPNNRGVKPDGPLSRFSYLDQLDELLADHERRAKMPPRGPIPRPGGDPSARIAALIRDLDQIDERQMMSPGAAHPGGSPYVRALVLEGDPAVGPLLEALEAETNPLTRSVDMGRGNSPHRYVHPTSEAVLSALTGILKTNDFDAKISSNFRASDARTRRELAKAIRAYWEKNRAIPPVERWYRDLADDSAKAERWVEAAGAIVHPTSGMRVFAPNYRSPRPAGVPVAGESLRVGRDPSVTALLARRASQLLGNSRGIYPEQSYNFAVSLAWDLLEWDEKASLPTLREVSAACLERLRGPAGNGQQQQRNWQDHAIASTLATFASIRDRLGDAGAIDEYAAWARTSSPGLMMNSQNRAFEPLWDFADRPSIAEATRHLFNDPDSAWLPLIEKLQDEHGAPFGNKFASAFVVLAPYRAAVIKALGDKSPFGTFEKTGGDSVSYKLNRGQSWQSGGSFGPQIRDVPTGVEIPFRACDYLAMQLSDLQGAPQCQVYWPEPRRDAAIASMVDFLKKYGPCYSTKSPPDDPFHQPWETSRAHLRFPTLGRPASLADVAEGRAIFSLEGQGEARLVPIASFPQGARWLTLKDHPVQTSDSEGKTSIQYETGGRVWQAEEVREGGEWRRYYGFVGKNVVARVPASEVDFSAQSYLWEQRPDGLDPSLVPVEPGQKGYEPGRPIAFALKVRNQAGLPRRAPTEFVRIGPDGRPEIRRGVTLALTRTPPRRPDLGIDRDDRAFSSSGSDLPPEDVAPTRSAHFEPGGASRTLESTEAFEAARLVVGDWFDVSKPGDYQLVVTFGAESGVGEGATARAFFQVSAP